MRTFGKPARQSMWRLPLLLAVGCVVGSLAGAEAGSQGSTETIAQSGVSGGPTLTPTIPVIPAPQPVPQRETKPAPAVQPPEAPRRECPPTRYIDCMPPVGETKRPLCNEEYLDWAKTHCPHVQVVY
jgi:hypothetical protein